MECHRLDTCPIPKSETPLFVNEPWLVDNSKVQFELRTRAPEFQEDNIRIYVPLDLNKVAILRRLERIIRQYGEVNKNNESFFRQDVELLVSQVEIYEQVRLFEHQKESEEIAKM